MRAIVSPLFVGALISATTPAAAQEFGHRTSLGIEVPVLSVGYLGISQGHRTTTGMGLFASGADLNGQYGLSNSSILGLRLGVSRETAALSGSPTSAQSQISLAPRYEYYFKPDRPTRPHVGIEAGFARSTTTGEVANTDWLIGPTGGISYFANSNWQFDVNASFFLSTGSYGPISTTGQAFVLRVDISAWFGGKAQSAQSAPPPQEGGLGLSGTAPSVPPPAKTATDSSEWKGAAPLSPQNSTAPASTPSPTPVPTASSTPTPATPESAAPAEALLAKEGRRMTLDLHEGRRLTLVAVTAGTEKKVKFILAKTPADASLKWCSTVDIHVPDQNDGKIDVRYKLLTTPSGEVATLSAEVPAEVLKPLIEAPMPKQPQLTPDHWLGVCGQDWPLSTLERRQLKDFLKKL